MWQQLGTKVQGVDKARTGDTTFTVWNMIGLSGFPAAQTGGVVDLFLPFWFGCVANIRSNASAGLPNEETIVSASSLHIGLQEPHQKREAHVRPPPRGGRTDFAIKSGSVHDFCHN